MSLVTQSDHAAFKALHRDYFDDMAGITITWKRLNYNLDRFGEGEAQAFTEIGLKAIVGFNDFRTWPVNRPSVAGARDLEHLYLLINMDYLSENGYVTDWGNFNFDPTLDEFVHAGISYFPVGDTDVAQIYAEAGYYMVILQRKPPETGGQLR